MVKAPKKFAKLLTTALLHIKAQRGQSLTALQDEIGYEIGREGGGFILYLRKGHVPAFPDDVEKLARALVRRGGLARPECREFLLSADYPDPPTVVNRLFPTQEDNIVASDPPYPPSSFVDGPAITQPQQFYGRTRELTRIFGWWSHFPLGHVAVVGPRRSGKTSLLHYLHKITRTPATALRPGQRNDWLPQPQRYRWIWVDFQDPRMRKPATLLGHLLQGMKLPPPEECTLDRFVDLVTATPLPHPTIILMDELGAGLAAADLDQAFWWGLRAVVNTADAGNLAFLVAAHAPPIQLADDRGKASPFFNMFNTVRLGPFSPEEADEFMISAPLPLNAADKEWILHQSGRWPLLLQILCHERLQALQRQETHDEWRSEALRRLADHRHLLEQTHGA